MHAGRVTITLALLVLISGCASELLDNTGGDPPDSNIPDVSYSTDVQPVLTASCGGSFCHINGAAGNVQLNSFSNATSSVGAQYGSAIILPGDSSTSPLMDKLQSSPRLGSRMPLGRSPLSETEITMIASWIDDGALDN